jgi:periplasmic protein TonB
MLPVHRFSPSRCKGLIAAACAHFLLGVAVWQLLTSPRDSVAQPPLLVSLLSAPREATPVDRLPAPKPLPQPVLAAPLPLPDLRVPDTAPTPSAPPAVQPPVDTAPATRAVPATAEPASAAAAPAARPVPLPPRLLRADQVRYLVMPPAETPRLSRRAGESGVVWLRVRIDAQGRPAQITLHRSSGFRRLDEQALAAMAQARFAPQMLDGEAVEVEVIAPIEYAAD